MIVQITLTIFTSRTHREARITKFIILCKRILSRSCEREESKRIFFNRIFPENLFYSIEQFSVSTESYAVPVA